MICAAVDGDKDQRLGEDVDLVFRQRVPTDPGVAMFHECGVEHRVEEVAGQQPIAGGGGVVTRLVQREHVVGHLVVQPLAQTQAADLEPCHRDLVVLASPELDEDIVAVPMLTVEL